MRPTAVLDEEISSPLLLFVVGLALHMFSVGSVGWGVAMHRSCVICIHQLITVIHCLSVLALLILIIIIHYLQQSGHQMQQGVDTPHH